MFQSNIYYFMRIKVYIVFIEEIWVQIYAFRVHVCGYFWVQSLFLLGACMRKRLGAKYAVVGCKVYGDVWVQSICLLGASLIRLIACLIVGSLPDSR